ncbi:MAG: hypothetical protein ACLR7N_12005 [Roseburia hominis]
MYEKKCSEQEKTVQRVELFAKLVRGDADAIQRLLNQLWEEGKITPITNEIISLPQEKKRFRDLILKFRIIWIR